MLPLLLLPLELTLRRGLGFCLWGIHPMPTRLLKCLQWAVAYGHRGRQRRSEAANCSAGLHWRISPKSVIEATRPAGERGQGSRLAALPHVKTNKAHGSARRERRDRVPAVGEANRMQPRPASGFSFRWAVPDGRRHPLRPAAARARD